MYLYLQKKRGKNPQNRRFPRRAFVGKGGQSKPQQFKLLILLIYTFSVLSLHLETTVTKLVSHRPIKCQSRVRSQRGTKVNGSDHGGSPLLKPVGIPIATNLVSGPANREHRELIGGKTMPLGTNYSFYCLECCQFFRI